ncbi:hypothetical protein [Mycolicibacterium sarraceniae]|uniref:hypothetical protein n=1 Tax=Mycolicibacterium sarraceniae TaxID=1534348 RepID=UPI0013D6FCED|nr:hypothetical protein [Mycolicibacterium sarraceniae]
MSLRSVAEGETGGQGIPMDATRRPDAVADRRWVSAILGGLGILALGVLVAAVVSMSHESAHPVGQSHPPATAATTAVSAAPVNHTATSPSPPTSWSVSAVASTMAPPPAAPPSAAAPKREPSVRQRLHDMFPKLFPGH